MERMGGRERGCKTNVVAFKKREGGKKKERAIKGGRKEEKKLLRFFLNLPSRKCFVRIS